MSWGRGKGGIDRTPRVKPIQQIEVSEKHPYRRLIAVLVLVAVAAVAIGSGVSALLSQPTGWQVIEGSSSKPSCLNEFVLQYELGAGEQSARSEARTLKKLWSEACESAYALFSAFAEADGGIAALNRSPNVAITVDAALYRALERIVQSGNRMPFLGVLYGYYESLVAAENDVEVSRFDPFGNAELAAYYKKVAAFAQDADAVGLELLADRQVRLTVRADYLAWAEAEGIDCFFDLGWMQNAFLADYLAERLTEAGYTNGTLSSVDGFTRTLCEGSFGGNVFDLVGDTAGYAGQFSYTGPAAVVDLRSFGVNAQDAARFYVNAAGDTRSLYLDVQDGLCRTALHSLVVYGKDQTCAALALQAGTLFVAEQLDTDALLELTGSGALNAIWCEGSTLLYTEQGLRLGGLQENAEHPYTPKWVQKQ